jgi:hypothetical protein
MTAVAEFFVFVHRGNWVIGFDEKVFGPCGTEARALELATASAAKAAARGFNARVLGQEEGNTFRLRWTAEGGLDVHDWVPSQRRQSE